MQLFIYLFTFDGTIILQVKRLELALLKHWLRKGLKPVDHNLVSNVTQYVKDPSDL